MESIVFDASFGDHASRVELNKPTGGADIWQVMIDNFYQGVLVKVHGEWTGHFNPSSELTAEDAQILGEVIDQRGALRE